MPIPYIKNAKKHSDSQLKQIALSLKEYGWRQPIVVDVNDTIIVGHGRWEAYQRYPEGITEPWVVKADDLTPTQVKGYRLMDNKTNESDWDMELALEELKELELGGFNMELTGFDQWSKQENLLNVVNSRDTEWVGMPEFEPADNPYKIIINFESEKDRDDFQQKYNFEFIYKQAKAWSTWYPFKGREDLASLKYESV